MTAQRPEGSRGNAHRLFGKPAGPLTQGMPRLASSAACRGGSRGSSSPAAAVTQEAARVPPPSAHCGTGDTVRLRSEPRPWRPPRRLAQAVPPPLCVRRDDCRGGWEAKGGSSRSALFWGSCRKERERWDYWNDSGFFEAAKP